jgi:hypothetical protein
LKIRQIKLPNLLGIILVQYTYTASHLGVVSVVMLSVTLWALVGPSIQVNVSWFEYWHFLLFGGVGFLLLGLVDYALFYPTRQAYLNRQAAKHPNPAMDLLYEINDRLKKVEKRLKAYEKGNGNNPGNPCDDDGSGYGASGAV